MREIRVLLTRRRNCLYVETLIAATTAWGSWRAYIAARFERAVPSDVPARGLVVGASASVLVGRKFSSRPGLTKTL